MAGWPTRTATERNDTTVPIRCGRDDKYKRALGLTGPDLYFFFFFLLGASYLSLVPDSRNGISGESPLTRII